VRDKAEAGYVWFNLFEKSRCLMKRLDSVPLIELGQDVRVS
jgi:hypothetical protein